MWILESFSEIGFQKPFLIFSLTLGAAFLLLAHLFPVNPLGQPVLYAIVAADACFCWSRHQTIARAAIAFGAAYLLAVRMLEYLPLFAVGLSLIAGLLAFAESFRMWKWAIVSCAVFAGILSTSVWQQMYFLSSALPQSLLPILHAATFSFCIVIALSIYLLEKDRVQQAYEHYNWMPRSEETMFAGQATDIYAQLKNRLPKEHFTEFAEKIVHLCHQLQEISAEIAQCSPETIEQEIREIRNKKEITGDAVACGQYDQALRNKIRRREHYSGLQIQSERIRGQILNYLSALENIRLAYANRDYKSGAENKDTVDFFMNMARLQAESACDNAEAYERLVASAN